MSSSVDPAASSPPSCQQHQEDSEANREWQGVARVREVFQGVVAGVTELVRLRPAHPKPPTGAASPRP